VHLNVVDWVGIGLIVVSALGGMRRGLVVSALSLIGLIGGAYAGSRIAPHLLSGGAKSPWTPVAGLAGAVFGAVLFQTAAVFAGSFVRGGLRFTPLRFVDSLGGIAFGAATGLVLVWVIGAAALLVPGQTKLRREVGQSSFVRRLDQAVPPDRFLHMLARIDPFPAIVGPKPPTAPPTRAIAASSKVRAASSDVVKVLGSACGVGVEGSGWYVRRDLVVTAAHVVAGEQTTAIQVPGIHGKHTARVVAFDKLNDIAVLRIFGATASRPLPLVDPRPGASVAIVGYPGNGPLHFTPGRIGLTEEALTEDAYGNGR